MSTKTLAYITNADSKNVSVIDTSTFRVLTTIDLDADANPHGIAVTPDGKYAYVTNFLGSLGVTVINTVTNKKIKEIIPDVSTNFVAIAISPDGEHAYAADTLDNKIYIINTSTKELEGRPIRLDGEPEKIVITPDGRYAYVTHNFKKSLSKIDFHTNTVKNIPMDNFYYRGITIQPDGSKIYIVNGYGDIVILDTKEDIIDTTLSIGGFLGNANITPDGKFLYVTKYTDDTVYVINTEDGSILDTITVGSYPYEIRITPDGTYAFVLNRNSDNVSVIDIKQENQVLPSIAVGKTPFGIAITKVPEKQTEPEKSRADLSVSITDYPYPVKVGEPLTYTIKVTNHGPDKATDVIVHDTLKHVDIVLVNTSQGICREINGVITCELGSLNSGQEAVITIIVIPRYLGKMINFVIVEGREEDSNPKNNIARQETIVLGPAPFHQSSSM